MNYMFGIDVCRNRGNTLDKAVLRIWVFLSLILVWKYPLPPLKSQGCQNVPIVLCIKFLLLCLSAKTSWSQMGPTGQVEMPSSTVTVQSSSVGATPTPPSVLPPHPSSTPTPIQPQQPSVNEPRFIYSDITVTSLRGLEPHISVSVPQVG